MTKSTITREESVQAVFDLKVGYRLGFADLEILKRVARMALAAMDSEPVAWKVRFKLEGQPGSNFNKFFENRKAMNDVVSLHELGGFNIDVTPLYRHAQPAKGLELAGWQFKSVNGDWLGLIDEHGKNQAVRDGYEVREVFAMADGVNDRDQVRREHAEWSQATFGNVGPVGPLKHLAKEAIEAAAEPDDLSEWADMQFLMWDAQRRAGITDEQITKAMIDKLAVNKQRSWPEPKDGEPRLHIKEQPAPVVSADLLHTAASAIEDLLTTKDRTGAGVWFDLPFRLRSAANAQSPGSDPATVPGKWIPVSERMPEDRTQVILWDAEIGEVTSGHYSHKTQTFYHCGDAIENEITHWMLPPSAPQGVKP
ncbi:TPA: DUF550 domain-containing protein [Klebsiella pneumoniae]|nr:DUF550 domain-containing protein [Klebsiella pneumoniae]